MFDIDKIKEQVTPYGIAAYLNMRMRRSGNTIFIECPSHERVLGRADRHINNCVLGDTFQNAYYCFGCQSHGDCFDMIADFKKLDRKADFYEILSIAAESCGGAQFFRVDDPGRLKKGKKNEQESLGDIDISAEDLKTLGISHLVEVKRYDECFDASQINKDYGFICDTFLPKYKKLPDVSYLSAKPENTSFFKLPANLCKELILTRCRKLMDLYRELSCSDLSGQLGLPDSSIKNRILSEQLQDHYRLRYLEVEDIYKRVADQNEIAVIDDSWLFEK